MHSAFIDNQAETKAVRFMRAVLRGALACALVFGAGTAMAQQHGDRRDEFMQQQQQQQQQQGGRGRFWLPQQDRDQREAEQRAYEEQQRRAQQQYQQDQREAARRGSGRLTPDERRDLRRQINEAGMDLYPQRGR